MDIVGNALHGFCSMFTNSGIKQEVEKFEDRVNYEVVKVLFDSANDMNDLKSVVKELI